ncbi:translation initiation factor IF-2 [Saccharolobus solfataricus]|uniref:Probable translation initiation factor IF-2 n=3 Tax=Saccharolobus solfataricus TaxID=2287 RepID=IF2P_SACS2|nr:translation initiation factor IF-2 [Saccharolobus solfataricus]Q980Q8.1 RecName: Full=Probable translation initiation factor IF-2 [Saccharolobus solfataricus P2]AAK40570.1 Translation initiation factor IF2 homolog (infB) [Saccharolobus solfataricus P2]AKA73550.1 translation initiation factor IF-2 [Saccharolobus solfataricus]AKA76248.1 translation initiation factor IF-2 [Saccharolobus solfataricus]AKA78940.1 translation initiation factor IF-2 [Saccharolobus solfataricus]AZF68018.1 translati
MKISNSERRLRQPIVVVLGHVDHGKTTLLDKIRGTTVVKKEPGEMTQEVGASFVPSYIIEKLAEPLKKVIPIKLQIPGLLFIDTPGHEYFSNLRRRGGSVADIAILVVDITEGLQKQSIESIQILRERKVPFLIAANKIDKIPGWKSNNDIPFLASIEKQRNDVKVYLDNLVYNLVSQLANLGFSSERYDRIKDFTKTVAIVPVSAKTGEGVADLLALLAGLTQRYLETRLKFAEGPAKGVILEVKEDPGLGHTIDVIIYDGVLKKNDTIILGGINGIIITKVRGIFVPRPLQDMKLSKYDLTPIDEVYAAAGVKISAPNLEEALAGSPIYVVEDESKVERYKQQIEEEIKEVRLYSDIDGIILKADSLGTLEALVSALQREGIPIRLADIGPISKRDVIEASIVAQRSKEYGIIAAFRVKLLQGIDTSGIKILYNEIIYQLIEDIKKHINDVREAEKRRTFDTLILPGKIKILPGYVFRRSDPVVVGIEVIGGIIRPKYPLIKEDGRRVGEVLQIQDNKKSLERATKGMEVAISIKGNIMIGRHVNEGDVLYTDVPKEDLEILVNKYPSSITDDMREVIKEIIRIKRKEDPLYGLGLQI